MHTEELLQLYEGEKLFNRTFHIRRVLLFHLPSFYVTLTVFPTMVILVLVSTSSACPSRFMNEDMPFTPHFLAKQLSVLLHLHQNTTSP